MSIYVSIQDIKTCKNKFIKDIWKLSHVIVYVIITGNVYNVDVTILNKRSFELDVIFILTNQSTYLSNASAGAAFGLECIMHCLAILYHKRYQVM